MKFMVMIFAIFSSSSFAIETVTHVDVGQYLGRWYQQARNPLAFEPLDCSCAQQTLTLQNDGLVGVYNSCNIGGANGQLTEIWGTAENLDKNSNAKFIVDFGLPKMGSYWIIALDSYYRWAVVTDKDETSLYILSKTPVLEEGLYQDALNAATAKTDISNLVETNHLGCTYP